jgi:hypothetical protein
LDVSDRVTRYSEKALMALTSLFIDPWQISAFIDRWQISANQAAVAQKRSGENSMRPLVRMIRLMVLAPAALQSLVVQAQSEKTNTPYPSMAAIDT